MQFLSGEINLYNRWSKGQLLSLYSDTYILADPFQATWCPIYRGSYIVFGVLALTKIILALATRESEAHSLWHPVYASTLTRTIPKATRVKPPHVTLQWWVSPTICTCVPLNPHK